jgi:hypothetical protein
MLKTQAIDGNTRRNGPDFRESTGISEEKNIFFRNFGITLNCFHEPVQDSFLKKKHLVIYDIPRMARTVNKSLSLTIGVDHRPDHRTAQSWIILFEFYTALFWPPDEVLNTNF